MITATFASPPPPPNPSIYHIYISPSPPHQRIIYGGQCLYSQNNPSHPPNHFFTLPSHVLFLNLMRFFSCVFSLFSTTDKISLPFHVVLNFISFSPLRFISFFPSLSFFFLQCLAGKGELSTPAFKTSFLFRT